MDHEPNRPVPIRPEPGAPELGGELPEPEPRVARLPALLALGSLAVGALLAARELLRGR